MYNLPQFLQLTTFKSNIDAIQLLFPEDSFDIEKQENVYQKNNLKITCISDKKQRLYESAEITISRFVNSVDHPTYTLHIAYPSLNYPSLHVGEYHKTHRTTFSCLSVDDNKLTLAIVDERNGESYDIGCSMEDYKKTPKSVYSDITIAIDNVGHTTIARPLDLSALKIATTYEEIANRAFKGNSSFLFRSKGIRHILRQIEL